METNGQQNTPPATQQILIQSDGLTVRVQLGCDPAVAEGLLARALGHVQRELLVARLARAAEPKVEIANSFPRML